MGTVADAKSGNGKLIKGKQYNEPGVGRYPGFSATGQDIFCDVYDHDRDAIIISAVGARCGKCFLASGKWTAVANTHVLLPDVKQIDNKCLWYMVNDEMFWVRSGTAQSFVKVRKSLEIEIPVPPLPEQRRIVSAIETQLGRLDATVARLHAANAKLKRYKQAVLKAAVEGRLENPDNPEGELPQGWRHVEIKDIAELLNGDRGKNYPSSKHYVDEGAPFINTGHIEPTGQLSEERMNYITRKRFDILNAGKIIKGDIVYCLRGATLGKTAIVDLEEGAIASSLMIIRLNANISREFIYYYLTGDLGRRNIQEYDNGTAQPNLSGKSVGKYLVPLPPYDEQLRIVEHVGVRLTEIEHLGATLDAQLAQSTRLRQAVLKRAFEGRLVGGVEPRIR